jgi:NADPH2:quinone reductase
MKAIRVHQFGGPEVLKLEEVPDLRPGPREVLVRIKAVGVNPVDTYRCSGSNPDLTLPYTPGSDAAGVVEVVGEGVRRFKPGDRVYTSGTLTGAYADAALCEGGQVHLLPKQISFEQGAAIGIPYATAYRALFQKARVVAGETVLIHGATGGVGLAAVQLARAAGLVVIGTGGSPKGRDLAAEQGAHHLLDHRAPGYLDQVWMLTEGRGVDVILEMLANVNLGKDLKVIAEGGRIVVIGSRGPVEINPRDAMNQEATILAMLLFNATEKEVASLHAALGAGLENGTLRPVIGRKFSLSEAAQAHQAVMAPGAYGKIVLVP